MILNERIKERRIELGMTLEEVAQRVGVSRQTIQRYESGVINIPSDKLISISMALSIDPGYLMGWKELHGKSSKPPLPVFDYPYVSESISAGMLENVDALMELPTMSVPDALLGQYARDKSIVFMKVNGESMNNVIENHTIMAVKTGIEKEQLHNGDIVIASNHGSYTVKRFYNDTAHQRIILRPDSSEPSFSDIIIPYEEAEDFSIFGRVVIYSVVL